MKKGCLIWGSIGVIIVLLAVGILSWGISTYNKIVALEQGVVSQWGNVETQYQRRADLIPNFVNTVKGAAAFEQETLTQVIEARSRASQVTLDPSNMTAGDMQQFQEVQGEVSSALSRLLVVVEQYPDIKATQNFRDLQVELEGTENRISVERRNFNEKAREFNTYIKKFPQSIIAGMKGFSERPYFEAMEGTETAPVIQF
ncbi:MAG: LemA family protein [Bacteroidales bacterium]|nr:LemA family protein [Bacteroidales bacterium]